MSETYYLTFEVKALPGTDIQGEKEAIAMDLERLGNVRLVHIEPARPEQLSLF